RPAGGKLSERAGAPAPADAATRLASTGPRGAGAARRTRRAGVQPADAQLPLPPLRPRHSPVGEHSAAQLAGPARQVLELQGRQRPTLPAGGARVRPALGLRRLALRLRLGLRRPVAADLGLAGHEPDRRGPSVAAGRAGAAL